MELGSTSQIKCQVCEKNFIDVKSLEVHMKMQQMKKTHICDHCGAKFNRKYHLDRHIVVVHGDGL